MRQNFKQSMLAILANQQKNQLTESYADKQLTEAANFSMVQKLHIARNHGRHGWWDSQVCSIEYLYQLRDRAINDKDHISVLNFTAMIAMRESIICKEIESRQLALEALRDAIQVSKEFGLLRTADGIVVTGAIDNENGFTLVNQ